LQTWKSFDEILVIILSFFFDISLLYRTLCRKRCLDGISYSRSMKTGWSDVNYLWQVVVCAEHQRLWGCSFEDMAFSMIMLLVYQS